MADLPESVSRGLARVPAGPKLIGLGVALFVVTRIVNWLPLGLVGSWINGILWIGIVASLAFGGWLVYRQATREG